MNSPLPIIILAAIPVLMAVGGLLLVLAHRHQELAGVGGVQKSMKGRSSPHDSPDQRSESDLSSSPAQMPSLTLETPESDEDDHA